MQAQARRLKHVAFQPLADMTSAYDTVSHIAMSVASNVYTMPQDANERLITHVGGHARVVNTAYGLGDISKAEKLTGGFAQGANSSPDLFIWALTPAHEYAESKLKGYKLVTHEEEAEVKLANYADDDSPFNGGEASTKQEAEAILNETQEGVEALGIGCVIAGVRMNQSKCFLNMSPQARKLLGTPLLKLVAINAHGRLVKGDVTLVATEGDPEGATAEERGATRYLGAWLAWGEQDQWREQDAVIQRATSAYANRSAMVQPSFKVASATAISVLYQRLKLMLLVKPPSTEQSTAIRTAIARSGLRALRLAPLVNSTHESAITDYLLRPMQLGGAGMGDPIAQAAADAAVTLQAGLAHPSKAIRAASLARVEAASREADAHSDDNVLHFLRDAAEIQLHRGRHRAQPTRQPGDHVPYQRQLQHALSPSAIAIITAANTTAPLTLAKHGKELTGGGKLPIDVRRSKQLNPRANDASKEKPPANKLANPWPIPPDATTEDVKHKWRPMVVELHRRWLQLRTTKVKDMKLPCGDDVPELIKHRSSMSEVTGNQSLDELRSKILALPQKRGAVALICDAACMKGGLCHRSNWIEPARAIIAEVNAAAKMVPPASLPPPPMELSHPLVPWTPLPAVLSPERSRAMLLPILDGIVWMALNRQQLDSLETTGQLSPKGSASLTPLQSVRNTSAEDCYLHTTRDQCTAIRYANDRPATRTQHIVMLDALAIIATYGEERVHRIDTVEGRRIHAIPEDSMEGHFARRDFEWLLNVPHLSLSKGHILLLRDISTLNLGDDKLSADDVMLRADAQALVEHNQFVACAYRQSMEFTAKPQAFSVQRRTLILATDASKVDGADRGVVQELSATAPSTVQPSFEQVIAQETAQLMADVANGHLVWLYWQDHDQFEADWVLAQATPKSRTDVIINLAVIDAPGLVGPWGNNVQGVTLRQLGAIQQAGRTIRIQQLPPTIEQQSKAQAGTIDLTKVIAVSTKERAQATTYELNHADGSGHRLSPPPEEYLDPTLFTIHILAEVQRAWTTMPRRKVDQLKRRVKAEGVTTDPYLEMAKIAWAEHQHRERLPPPPTAKRASPRRPQLNKPPSAARTKLQEKAAFDAARAIARLRDGSQPAALGFHTTAAPTACPCIQGKLCLVSSTSTILSQGYNQCIRALSGPEPNGWKDVPKPSPAPMPACICGETFASELERQMHVDSAPHGTCHDVPPESRPRLSYAYVLFDLDAPSPFEAFIAVGAARIPSRAETHEHSTSAEERAMRIAYDETKDMMPNECNVLNSTDSNAMRLTVEATIMHEASPRKQARTPEMGELQAAAATIDELNKRGIDALPAWEPAYHNRVKRGTADGRDNILARLNHACDRLAGREAEGGRSNELMHYEAMQPLQLASYYWTSSGAPLLGDPFERIAKLAATVTAQRSIEEELARPSEKRTQANLLLRLGRQGTVDLKRMAAVWQALPSPLLEEAVRSSLGRLSCTVNELTAIGGDPEAEAIHRIVNKGQADTPCHLCPKGRDSRRHWRYECRASATELQHVPLVIAAQMASAGYALWFDPKRRLTPDANSQANAHRWRASTAFEQSNEQRHLVVITSNTATHQATAERLNCLTSIWRSESISSLAEQAVIVMKEAVIKAHAQDSSMHMVAQVPLELRAWLRDAFHLHGEAMTSALTLSTIFPELPHVVGHAWASAPEWTARHDDPKSSTWSQRPWPHSVLITVHEHSSGALARVWKKAAATALAGHQVVAIVHESREHSCLQYQSMGAHAIALFPAGTLALGHAAGWPNDASDPVHSTHAWTCDGYQHLHPPHESQPGLLRRHRRIFNEHDVRIVLFTPARQQDATAHITQQQLRELAYLAAATGGMGSGAPTRWAATWYGSSGDAQTLAWTAQCSCPTFNFLAPWRMAMWQPTREATPLPLPPQSCGDTTAEATEAARELHMLSQTHESKDYVPDGAVPTNLIRLLRALGVAEAEVTPLIAAIISGQLRAVMHVAKQRCLQVTHHWQRVGVPLESLGSMRCPQLTNCHCCFEARRQLYLIKQTAGDAEAALIDRMISDHLDAINSRLEGTGATRAAKILTHALRTGGACVCFECAIPVVVERHARRKLPAKASQPEPAAQPTTAQEASGPSQAASGRGAPRQARAMASVRYVPPDERRERYAKQLEQQQRDASAKAAITAELRAIGTQPNEHAMSLERVSARKAVVLRQLAYGSSTIIDKIFDAEGTSWLVVDVAPSTTTGGMVAYAIDLARSTRVQGRAIDEARQWELSHIKALFRDNSTRRAQPTGEEEDPDQEDECDAQPDSDEDDFQPDDHHAPSDDDMDDEAVVTDTAREEADNFLANLGPCQPAPPQPPPKQPPPPPALSLPPQPQRPPPPPTIDRTPPSLPHLHPSPMLSDSIVQQPTAPRQGAPQGVNGLATLPSLAEPSSAASGQERAEQGESSSDSAPAAHASGQTAHDPAHGASGDQGKRGTATRQKRGGRKRQREAAAAATSAAVDEQLAARARAAAPAPHNDDYMI